MASGPVGSESVCYPRVYTPVGARSPDMVGAAPGWQPADDIRAEVDALLLSADDHPPCVDPDVLAEVALLLGIGGLSLAGSPFGDGSPVAASPCASPGLLAQPEFEPSPLPAVERSDGATRVGRNLADALAAVALAPSAPAYLSAPLCHWSDVRVPASGSVSAARAAVASAAR